MSGNFRDQLSKMIQARGLGLLWLAMVCGLLFSALHSAEPTHALTLKLKAEALSCEDTYQMAVWGQDSYGGGQPPALDSAAFGKRVRELFLEKLDPHHLLLAQADVDAFEKSIAPLWSALFATRACGPFEKWMSEEFPAAKKRYLERLKGLDFAKLMPTAAKNVELDADLRISKPKTYAKNEAELKARLEKAVKRIAAVTSEPLLRAYGGDRGKLIGETLDQILFGEIALSPRQVLAKALLGGIDPYSTYFSPVEFEDFYQDLAGGTSGIGVKVRHVPDGLLIERVIPDSPASASKQVRAGDIIIAVDNIRVASLPAPASKHLLKGAELSRVTLKIARASQPKPLTVSLRRKRFSFEEARVTHSLIGNPDSKEGAVAVIEVPSFYGRAGIDAANEERSSAEDLEKVMKEILKPKKHISAMVLDLRGNPGGFLEEAVSMAGLFLGEQPVVAVVENRRRRLMSPESEADALYRGPLVVLVDEESASASEVLAGALKDYQRAVIVGASHTYGKGSVQKLFHLGREAFGTTSPRLPKADGVVKLTTSVFYSPLGHSPANGGVTPHITIASKHEDDEERAPKVAAIPEHTAFVGERTVQELRRRELRMNERIEIIRDGRSKKHDDVQKLIDSSVKKALGMESSDEAEVKGLGEAVAIAKDLGKMEGTVTPMVVRQVAE